MKYLVLCFLFPSLLLAQVNTESLRKSSKSGRDHHLKLGLSTKSGNTSKTDYSVFYRFDYGHKEWYWLGLVNYDFGKAQGEEYANSGFYHVRGGYKITPRFSYEGFVQHQYNVYRLLKNRELLGAGVRYKLNTLFSLPGTYYVGTSLMGEWETVTGYSSTNVIRSSNYITFNVPLSTSVTLSGTTYFQVLPSDISDYRVLADMALKTKLTDQISLSMNIYGLFDSDPPPTVRDYDLAISNSLVFNF